MRIRRAFSALVVLGVLIAISVLPSDTAPKALVVRLGIAFVIGWLLFGTVRRAMGSFVAGPPPAPETVEAEESEVVYVCGVCGTRVRLELASTGKAPRHCGEYMEPELLSR